MNKDNGFTEWEKSVDIRLGKIETEIKLHKWYATVVGPIVMTLMIFIMNHVLHFIVV